MLENIACNYLARTKKIEFSNGMCCGVYIKGTERNFIFLSKVAACEHEFFLQIVPKRCFMTVRLVAFNFFGWGLENINFRFCHAQSL